MRYLGVVLVLAWLSTGCGETVLTQWPKQQIFNQYFRLQDVKLGMSQAEVVASWARRRCRKRGNTGPAATPFTREVITRAHAFGLRTIAWSRSLTPERAQQLGVERCADIDEVFRRGDIVSLHVALKPDTRRLVNAERLALLKPNAILINTTRGEVVDQAALRAALAAGKLRAGLDVFDPEPAEAAGAFDDPILRLPNLYGTHHIGASTEQAQEAIATEAIRIIETFIKTGVVLNCVNLATRTPARWQLVVRHYDRVGVLAFVMDQIRRAGINIEEVQNVIFEGAAAASCRIQLDVEPGPDLLRNIQAGNENIIGLELLRIV